MRRYGAPYKLTSPFGVDDASARVARMVDGAGLAGSGPGRPDGHGRVVDCVDLSRVGARPRGVGSTGADVGNPAGRRTYHLAGPGRGLPGSRGGTALHRGGAPPRRGRFRDRLPRHRSRALAVRMGPRAWRAPIISAAGGLGNLLGLLLAIHWWQVIGQPSLGTPAGDLFMFTMAANFAGY